MDHAQGAGVELHHRDRGVLDLDPFVRQAGGVGEHLDRRADDGDQQVDGVHGLVHDGAAAVQRPGAAPVAGVVVGLPAPPGVRGDRRRDACRGALRPPRGPSRWICRSGAGRSPRRSSRSAASASMIRSAAASETSIGFSTTTCLPASSAATARSACRPLGVQIVTASMSSRASRLPRVSSEIAGRHRIWRHGRGLSRGRVGDRDQLGGVSRWGEGLGVNVTDHAGADHGEPERWSGSHA